jgi:hypothetical protein
MMENPGRRALLVHGAGLVSAMVVTTLAGSRALAGEACVRAESESLRAGLNYVDPAPDPQQTCGACAFFTPEAGGACGRCVIMSGPVGASAHCDSWGPRS